MAKVAMARGSPKAPSSWRSGPDDMYFRVVELLRPSISLSSSPLTVSSSWAPSFPLTRSQKLATFFPRLSAEPRRVYGTSKRSANALLKPTISPLPSSCFVSLLGICTSSFRCSNTVSSSTELSSGSTRDRSVRMLSASVAAALEIISSAEWICSSVKSLSLAISKTHTKRLGLGLELEGGLELPDSATSVVPSPDSWLADRRASGTTRASWSSSALTSSTTFAASVATRFFGSAFSASVSRICAPVASSLESMVATSPMVLSPCATGASVCWLGNRSGIETSPVGTLSVAGASAAAEA
mmetsp:Transcript_1701/g.7426  ORF Transcript_1701/g.7426 Transcript_1701/m.7426 type:complete len:299 (+) Transcript_1701:1972-2868(+)